MQEFCSICLDVFSSYVCWCLLIQVGGWKFEMQWTSFKSVLCRLLNCMPIALFGIVFDYSHFWLEFSPQSFAWIKVQVTKPSAFQTSREEWKNLNNMAYAAECGSDMSTLPSQASKPARGLCPTPTLGRTNWFWHIPEPKLGLCSWWYCCKANPLSSRTLLSLRR